MKENKKHARSWKGVAVVAVVWSCLVCGALAKATQENPLRSFRIVDATGHVSAWYPAFSEWRRVEADADLWEGTLVQIGQNSSLTFAMNASAGFPSLDADTTQITINVPMVLRVQARIPRKVLLEDYFVRGFPDVPDAPDSSNEPLFNSMVEAWRRFAAMVTHQDVSRPFVDKAVGEKTDTSVSVRAKKIRLFYPTDGTIVITERFPNETRVSWRKVDVADALYGIRLWREEEPRPAPLAYTHQDYYTIKTHKEGSYFVQVSTLDGKWQSEVRQFNVVLPMVGRGEPPSRQAIIKPLPLVLPPSDFTFFSDRFPVSLTFEWERPNSAKGEQVFRFVLTDTKSRELFRRDTTELGITIKFSEPGSFRWSVASSPRDANWFVLSDMIMSEQRELEVERLDSSDPKTRGAPSLPWTRLLSKTKGVLYFDAGLSVD